MTKPWFRMEVKGAVAEIYVLGIIGDWIDDMLEDMGWGFDSVITAKKFKEELEALPQDVTTLRLHVNSPGGDVFGAVTIANLLRDQREKKGRTVESIIDGLAASAASILVQAGDPIRMADNALIMIHDPWTRAAGDASELMNAAAELEKVKSASLIPTYQWHSELSEEEISALMSAETWMDADEAIANGFATEKIEGLKAVAALSKSAVSILSVPEKYRDRVAAFIEPDPKPEKKDTPKAAAPAEVLKLCREGECLDAAEELVAGGASLEDVKARIEREKKTRAAAEARVKEIRGFCSVAKLDELADSYIKSGLSCADVKAQLAILTAKLDAAEVDGGLLPDHGTKPKAKIDVSQVYAERNRLHFAGSKKE